MDSSQKIVDISHSQTPPPSLQCSPSSPLEYFSAQDVDFVEPLHVRQVHFASAIQHPPPWAFTAGLLGAVSIMTMMAFLLEPPGYEIKVAFAGNSMQYVNVSYIRALSLFRKS